MDQQKQLNTMVAILRGAGTEGLPDAERGMRISALLREVGAGIDPAALNGGGNTIAMKSVEWMGRWGAGPFMALVSLGADTSMSMAIHQMSSAQMYGTIKECALVEAARNGFSDELHALFNSVKPGAVVAGDSIQSTHGTVMMQQTGVSKTD